MKTLTSRDEEELAELLTSGGEEGRPAAGWWTELLLLMVAVEGGAPVTSICQRPRHPASIARAYLRLIEAFSCLRLVHKRRVFIYGQLWR